MDCEKVKITPAVARQWLELVPEYQRRVKQWQVDKIALAIERGEWRENGSTFVFNAKGEFVDGQHRAHAINQAGKTVWSLVVRGVSGGEDTFSSIDDTVPRSARDFLDCDNVLVVAAVGKILWHVTNEDFPGANKKPPVTDLLRTIRPYLDTIKEDGIVYKGTKAGYIVGNGAFLAFLALYYKHIRKIEHAEKIDEFMERVADGIGLHGGSPILALRNRFTNKNGNERIKLLVARALILKALHAYMDGRHLTKLSFDPQKENFPELR